MSIFVNWWQAQPDPPEAPPRCRAQWCSHRTLFWESASMGSRNLYQENLLLVKQVFSAQFDSSHRVLQNNSYLYCNYILGCFLVTEYIPQSCSLQSKTQINMGYNENIWMSFDEAVELENTTTTAGIPALKGHTVNWSKYVAMNFWVNWQNIL